MNGQGVYKFSTENAPKKEFFESLLWPKTIYFDDYAEQEFVFPSDDKHAGKYSLELTPYMREPLRVLSPPDPTEQVVFIGPTQCGKTTLGNVAITCIMRHYPGRIMFVFPTDQMAEDHAVEKLEPTFEAMKDSLSGILYEKGTRRHSTKKKFRKFRGGYLELTSIGATGAIRSKSVRYLFMTDVDSRHFTVSSDGEGNPIELLSKRTDAFAGKKKILIESTPRQKGISQIENNYLKSSQGLFNIPCLKCGTYQFLEFGGKGEGYGFKYRLNQHGRVDRSWFVCAKCGQEIEEAKKYKMMLEGKYFHKHPENPIRGFKMNGFYGFVRWNQIGQEWIDAQEDWTKRQVFVNTRLAESFEMSGLNQPEWKALKDRASEYKMLTVPTEGLFLSMGVDTQDNRLVILIIAKGRNNQTWIIYFGEIYGDPNEPEVWGQHDHYIQRDYVHQSGNMLKIQSVAIDIGGHKGEAVKDYCSKRFPLVIAVKGKGKGNFDAPLLARPKAADVNYKGFVKKGSSLVWMVGTDGAKTELFSRLTLQGDGNNRIYFAKDLPDDFYLQLTAEKLITKHVGGREIQKWEPIRRRNDALDCLIYAEAGFSRFRHSVDWAKTENAIHSQRARIQKPKGKQERMWW